MKLPFTTEQFFGVFAKYNSEVYPAQIIIFILGIVSVILLFSNSKLKDRFAGIFLSLTWLWAGSVYHIYNFSAINKAAFVFGIIFMIQGVLILLTVFRKNFTVYKTSPGLSSYAGLLLIIYGLVIYPVIGYFQNQNPQMIISLGLPCPTTIFTFGFFLIGKNNFSRFTLVIPILWSLIGVSAAINLEVYQDIMILISAVTAGIFIFSPTQRNRKESITT